MNTHTHTHLALPLLRKPYITAFLSPWPGRGGDGGVGHEEEEEEEEVNAGCF